MEHRFQSSQAIFYTFYLSNRQRKLFQISSKILYNSMYNQTYIILKMQEYFSDLHSQSYQIWLPNQMSPQVQQPDAPDQDSDTNQVTHSLYFISINQLPLEDQTISTNNSTTSEDELSNCPTQGQNESQTASSDISQSTEMIEETYNNQGQSNTDNTQRTQAEQPLLRPRNHRRVDDNNNAHKFLITLLNEALKDIRLLAGFKKALKQEKTKFEKGSRYAFIIRLIDIQRIYPDKKEVVFQAFVKRLSQDLVLIQGNPKSELLWKLKDIYTQATLLSFAGDKIGATERIYKVGNDKEEKYRLKGIKKVEQHMKLYGFA